MTAAAESSGDKAPDLLTEDNIMAPVSYLPTSSDANVNTEERRIARPLAVLVPLIKEDMEQGGTAAALAGMPYFIAAGEKLLEAKAQMKHGEFMPWVKRNFTVSMQTTSDYMKLAVAAQNSSAIEFSSLSDFKRKTGSNPTYNLSDAIKPPTWHPPVQAVVETLDNETLNLRRDDLQRHEELDAQNVLALQLIAAGYRVLARELHPDKGGTRDGMRRLNGVRDRLKRFAAGYRVAS
jgi:Protein of unknown function (DUF3102)